MNDLSNEKLLTLAETLEDSCEAIVNREVQAFRDSGMSAEEYASLDEGTALADPTGQDGAGFQLAQALLTAVLAELRGRGIKLTSDWTVQCEHNSFLEAATT